MGVIHFVVLLCSFSTSLGLFVPNVAQPFQAPLATVPQAEVFQPQVPVVAPQAAVFQPQVAASQLQAGAFPQPAVAAAAFPQPAVAAASFPQPVVTNQASYVEYSSGPLGNAAGVNYVSPLRPAGVVSSVSPVAPSPVGPAFGSNTAIVA